MTDQQNTNKVTCPNCGQDIDVNDVLSHQLEEKIRQQFTEREAKQKQEVEAQLQSIQQQKVNLDQERVSLIEEAEKKVAEALREREVTLSTKIKKQVQMEQADQLKAMNDELNDKTQQLKAFNKAKTEIERLKREKESLKDEIEAEAERKLSDEITKEKEKIRKSVEQGSQLAIAERDKIISDLSGQLKDAQRKAEQGSSQLQGEVQELAIEQWLRDQFPLDSIEEVRKGANGADCLHVVNTRDQKNCGKIYYESKRTKSFSPSWVGKFKQDMIERSADVGVIVTQAMPGDMPRLGMKEGVWICTLEEFRGLSLVLRDAAIRLDAIKSSNENRGEKMAMLYDYLSGNEFRQQVEAIVEGFTQMQTDLESEKRSMQQIWKKREKTD